jgi:hypothetical protein
MGETVAEQVARKRAELKAKGEITDAPGVTEDVLKSGGSGFVRGVVGAPGMLADLNSLGERAAVWGNRKLYGDESADKLAASQKAQHESAPFALPSSEEMIDWTAKNVGGKAALKYEPQTKYGRVAQVAGEFTGGALLTGGASVWGKAATRGEKAISLAKELVAQGLVPGTASEIAGQVVDHIAPDSDWGTAVRIATGIASGTAGGITHDVRAPGARVEVPNAGSIDTRAARNVGYGVQAEGGPARIVAEQERIGPGATLADVGDTFRGQLAAGFNRPGPQQRVVRDFLEERKASLRGQDTALTRTLDGVFDPRSANFADEAADVRQARRDRANDLYTQARNSAGAGPIDVRELHAHADTLRPPIDPATGQPVAGYPLRDYERTIIDTADRLGQRNDFSFTFQQKRDLDAEIAAKVSRGEHVPDALRDARDYIDTALERATLRQDNTSIYGDARRAYREDSQIMEALGSGRSFFEDTKQGAREGADAFVRRWRDMSDTERQAYQMGLREAIGQKMDFATNDFTTGGNILGSNSMQQKLAVVLGEQARDQLTNRLQGLRRQRGTVQGTEAQSATARFQEGRKTIEDPDKPVVLPNLSRVQSATGAASLAAQTVAEKALGTRQRPRAERANVEHMQFLTRDLDNLAPHERAAALQRLQEIYAQSQQGRIAPSTLLGLQAGYQALRSEENRPGGPR